MQMKCTFDMTNIDGYTYIMYLMIIMMNGASDQFRFVVLL